MSISTNSGIIKVRIYGERHGDHWALVTLDFGLAAQGATKEEAYEKLDAQIKEYIYDAFCGADVAYQDQLINRKAPAVFFVKFYLAAIGAKVKALSDHLTSLIRVSIPTQDIITS